VKGILGFERTCSPVASWAQPTTGFVHVDPGVLREVVGSRWISVQETPEIIGAEVSVPQNAGEGAATEFSV
jgi:hypothetical protein